MERWRAWCKGSELLGGSGQAGGRARAAQANKSCASHNNGPALLATLSVNAGRPIWYICKGTHDFVFPPFPPLSLEPCNVEINLCRSAPRYRHCCREAAPASTAWLRLNLDAQPLCELSQTVLHAT